jgi:hypothetical protein
MTPNMAPAAVQPGRVARREALVDDRPQALADRQHGAGGHHQGDGGDEHAAAVGGEELEQGAGGVRAWDGRAAKVDGIVCAAEGR